MKHLIFGKHIQFEEPFSDANQIEDKGIVPCIDIMACDITTNSVLNVSSSFNRNNSKNDLLIGSTVDDGMYPVFHFTLEIVPPLSTNCDAADINGSATRSINSISSCKNGSFCSFSYVNIKYSSL